MIVPVALCLATQALAAPLDGAVVSGQATITQTGNRIDIQQQSARLVINWRAFSIGANEIVQFHQLNAQSLAFNRVTGGSGSVLSGQLLANGIVFLVNPAGIQVTPGGRAAVGGLVATTGALGTADFLAGRYTFAAPTGTASVVNGGSIVVPAGGSVVLAAAVVRNDGQIEAPGGAVGLGAAKTFAVDVDGDGLLRYQVGAGTAGALATNSGTIAAPGGHILVAARSTDAVTREVINVGGLVTADSVSVRNGEIVFDGGGQGVVTVTGQVQAKGAGAGDTGGTVKVLGDTVGVMDGARVDVSGAAGGGRLLVGGAWQGHGTERNAEITYVAPTARLTADATVAGNGGEVVVWSTQTTRDDGAISVRGGAQGGDGGRVEVSSKGTLDFQGTADRLAPGGAAGLLLLDPRDLTISGGAPANTAGTGTSPDPFAPGLGGGPSVLTVGDINAALAGGAVYVSTSGGGSITLTGAINSGSANALDIRSDGSFTGTNGASVNVGGAFSLRANGTVSYSTPTTAGGNVTIRGNVVNLGGGGATTITTTAGSIHVTADGSPIVNHATLSATAGVVLTSPTTNTLQPQQPLPPPPPPIQPGPGVGAPAPFQSPHGPLAAPGELGELGAPTGPLGGRPAGPGEALDSAFGAPLGLGEESSLGGRPPPGPPGSQPGAPPREPAAKPAVVQVIPGLLQREIVVAVGGSQTVPGVSQRYSISGNPALW